MKGSAWCETMASETTQRKTVYNEMEKRKLKSGKFHHPSSGGINFPAAQWILKIVIDFFYQCINYVAKRESTLSVKLS